MQIQLLTLSLVIWKRRQKKAYICPKPMFDFWVCSHIYLMLVNKPKLACIKLIFFFTNLFRNCSMLHVRCNISFICWNEITSNFLFYVFHFYKMFLLAISVNFLYLILCSHIANISVLLTFAHIPRSFSEDTVNRRPWMFTNSLLIYYTWLTS